MMRTHMEVKYQEPDDQELELISQYLCHEMTAAEEERFERKLRNDGGFYERAMPILEVWYLAGSVATAPAAAPVRPIERIGRVWNGWAAKASVVLSAAGIVIAVAIQRMGGVAGPPPVFVLHQDAPHGKARTVATAAPVPTPRKTFRNVQRQLDAAAAKALAARNDSIAAVIVAEATRVPLPEAAVATPVVVAAVDSLRPAEIVAPPSNWVPPVTTTPEPGTDPTVTLTNPLAPTTVGSGGASDSWWRRLLNGLRGGKPKPGGTGPTGVRMW